MTAPRESPFTFTPLEATGYLAAEHYLQPLLDELPAEGRQLYGRLVLVPGPARPSAWAQNVWYNPVITPVTSIRQAASALRSLQRNWAVYSFHQFRRAELIQDLLPHVAAKPLIFPNSPPTAPLGSWTLLTPHTLLAAPHCSSPFRHGEVHFIEDKTSPPNRAYLKLWEAFTRIGQYPQSGQLCLDLGACPGGWTWVMHHCGARVIAVDKAPLDPAIAALPGVQVRQQSAFALQPSDIGPIDWFCSDVICYPERLYRLITQWLESGLVRHYICTLKFQAATDHATARAFAAIPGSQLIHLHNNKHELTWIRLAS